MKQIRNALLTLLVCIVTVTHAPAQIEKELAPAVKKLSAGQKLTQQEKDDCHTRFLDYWESLILLC